MARTIRSTASWSRARKAAAAVVARSTIASSRAATSVSTNAGGSGGRMTVMATDATAAARRCHRALPAVSLRSPRARRAGECGCASRRDIRPSRGVAGHRHPRTDQALQGRARHRGRHLQRRARRGVRLPRPQRRRQDDHDPYAARPPAPDLRDRGDPRLRRLARRRRRPRPHGLPARRVRLRRAGHRRGAAGSLRRPPRDRRPRLRPLARRALRGRPAPPARGALAREPAEDRARSRPWCTARRWS